MDEGDIYLDALSEVIGNLNMRIKVLEKENAQLKHLSDPEAKQFNFMTALEMMKNGVLCRSMVSGKHIRIPNNYNGFIEDDGEFNSDHYIVLAEIEGLWERADAD